ncbi:MAG: hypothetical protein NC299_11970 [Lachnospiraceae bacterium]|nr:hypothetical protein [Lachnospiraceae bacterium]
MLDFSKQVFSRLTLHLRGSFPKIYTSRNENTSPPKFPAATIVQKNNVNYKWSIDSSSLENHVKVMFQIDIYTNDKDELERMELAESIRDETSDFMLGLGFNRTMCEPIPNVQDLSIYRISMRFEGVIGRDAIVYSE